MLNKVLDELGISEEDYKKQKSKIIDTNEILLFLSNNMVHLLDQTQITCQGMIRLSIKDHYKRTPKFLTVDQWVDLLMNNLSERLSKVRVTDVDSIMFDILKDFLTYQSYVKN